MICANCEGKLLPKIAQDTAYCSKCKAPMHKDCAFQCVKCGAFLCDKCAMSQKYQCDECYNLATIKLEFISSTMFESYEKCPYAFKHEHVLKTFTEEQRENKYSATGKLLHDLFDKYSQIRPLTDGVFDQMGKDYEAGFKLLNVKLFDSADDYADFKLRGFATMGNWFAEEIERPVPVATEKVHLIELPGIDVPVRATIDRLNQFEDGEYEVEDYKTGKVYSADMLRHNFQLPTYAMAVKSTYGKLPSSLVLRFPQHTNAQGRIQERRFERISEDVFVCSVKRGGTYSFSLAERLERMREIYRKIKHDEFPLNTANTHFCENFCVLARNGMCEGLSTKWQIANQRGY